MSEHNPPLSPNSEDEQRLLRLFRCLDNDSRSKTLQSLGKRLMMEAAIDPDVSFFESSEQAAREELQEEIDDRLKRLMPVYCVLMDLLDYDFDVTREGWQDAGTLISEVILGADLNDADFADMLVAAYLKGANDYDIPLPCDFADPEVSKEEAIDEMRDDLHREAVSFIKSWREDVVRRFEQAP